MTTKNIEVYTIDSHPNKELVYDWIRNNWYDLCDYYRDDMCQSLSCLCQRIDGKMSCYLSSNDQERSTVSIENYDSDVLKDLYDKRDICPLTGMVYDYDVIEGLYKGNLNSVVNSILKDEYKYIYSDAGLYELCECNEYYFYSDGTFYKGAQ